MADEVTDPYANQEILSVCLRFVDLPSPLNPHIKVCLITFMKLERANASTISKKILESLSDKDICLDPANIRGQAFDGAAVMSSGNCRCSSQAQGDCSTSSVHPLLFSLPSIYLLQQLAKFRR